MTLNNPDTQRILLVEDNPINQKVAMALLKGFGIESVAAGNGAEALQLVQQSGFDMILMDVQMPVMDGLQATQAIRALPTPLASIPIVAMTASDSAEDVAACRQAGMNDFIAKPIQRPRLQQVLATWLATEVSHAGDVAASGADPAVEKLRDIEGLDIDNGLRILHQDSALYMHLLALFLDNHRDDGDSLRAHQASNRLDAARQLAHGLRGAAGNLGLLRVQQQAMEVEAAIKQAEPEDRLVTLIQTLSSSLTDLCARIEPLLPSSPEPSPSADIDWPRVNAILARLEPLLASSDTQAHQLFEESRTLLHPALGPLLQQLGRCLDDFDFDAALAVLRSAREQCHLEDQP